LDAHEPHVALENDLEGNIAVILGEAGNIRERPDRNIGDRFGLWRTNRGLCLDRSGLRLHQTHCLTAAATARHVGRTHRVDTAAVTISPRRTTAIAARMGRTAAA